MKVVVIDCGVLSIINAIKFSMRKEEELVGYTVRSQMARVASIAPYQEECMISDLSFKIKNNYPTDDFFLIEKDEPHYVGLYHKQKKKSFSCLVGNRRPKNSPVMGRSY